MLISLGSCNKSVYFQQSEFGESKYIIYPDYFKYIEKTAHSDFSIKGTYRFTDSTAHFIFKDKTKIPYYYFIPNIKKRGKAKNSNAIDLNVILHRDSSALIMAIIYTLDVDMNVLTAEMTDMDGKLRLPISTKVKWIKVEYLGLATILLPFSHIEGYNATIFMEELQMGGRTNGNCVLEFIDVELEYQLNEKKDQLRRNGFRYFKK